MNEMGSERSPPLMQQPTADRGASRSVAPAPNRASIAVACVACRSRHLKCDGAVPCSRCITEGGACSYVKSRRGWKGPRRSRIHLAHEDGRSAMPGPTTSPTNASLASGLDTNSGLTQSNQTSPPLINFNSPTPPQELSLSSFATLPPQAGADPSTATSAFFAFFAPSHPFLPSMARTMELIREKGLFHLDLAIQFLGSFYIPSSPTQKYRDNLARTLLQQSPPKDGFAVQALLLFALGLHANGEEEPASQALYTAISLAMDIGMNHGEFAISFSGGSPVLAESWRRTWWELYVMNGMFAGVNPHVKFQLRDVPSTVPLPCEEKQFVSSEIPEPYTLESYDDAPFTAEEQIFSSYTYLVDAIRVLGRVLAIDVSDPFQLSAMDKVESSITNWKLHLPQSKREVITREGVVDEVLLRAHMVISAASIMLHRPRSTIGSKEVQEIRTCAPAGEHVLPTDTLEFHTAKAMQAAEDIAKFITLPSPLPRRTPFFTCAVVMAAVVHLSYWSFIVPDGEDASIKEMIKLDTGALKSLAQVWPVSKGCLGQVKGVAHEMFTSKKAMSIHLWNTISGDEILQRMIEDAVIEELPQ